jgi:hypothetical protein
MICAPHCVALWYSKYILEVLSLGSGFLFRVAKRRVWESLAVSCCQEYRQLVFGLVNDSSLV